MNQILVRHGRTNSNKERKVISTTDDSLDDFGIDQSKNAAILLAEFNITCILSSPSNRCIQTARLIQEKIDVPIIIDKRIRERYLGSFEGIDYSELSLIRKQEDKNIFDASQDWHDNHDVESDYEVFKRYSELLNSVMLTTEMDVCVVTHAGVIKSVLYHVLDVDEKRSNAIRNDTCSITILDYSNPDNPRLTGLINNKI